MKGTQSLRAVRAYSGLGIARQSAVEGHTLRVSAVSMTASVGLVSVALAVVTALAVAIDVRTRVSVAAVGWLYLLIVLPVTLRWGRTAGLLTAAVAAFLLITFLTEPRGLPYTRNGIDLIRLLLSVGCVAAAVLLVRPASREGSERDRKLVALAALSDDAAIGLGFDGKILSWSSGAGRLYGYAAPEVLSRPFSLLAPMIQPDTIAETRARFEHGERSLQYETQGLARDGRLLDVVLTIAPLRDPAGLLDGLLIRVQDVTPRRIIEQAIQAGNEAIHGAMQELPLGSLVLDAGGRVLVTNEQADSLLRLGSKRAYGRLVSGLFADQFALHPALHWDEIARAGDAKFLAVRSDGLQDGLHVEISRLAIDTPIHSARYLATLRDATADLRSAREQFVLRESPLAEQRPVSDPAFARVAVTIPVPAAVPDLHAVKADRTGEQELPARHALTNRELEVLSLVASSLSNQQIAEELGISLNTVERHVANIYRKLNIRGRVHATAYALQHGLTPPYDS